MHHPDVSELHQAVSAVVLSRTCDRNVAYRDGALVEAGCGSHGNVSFSTQTATTYIASLTEHLHLQLRVTITSEGAVVQQGVAALPPAVERIRVLEERILHDRADRLRFRNLRHRNVFSGRRSSAEQATIKVRRLDNRCATRDPIPLPRAHLDDVRQRSHGTRPRLLRWWARQLERVDAGAQPLLLVVLPAEIREVVWLAATVGVRRPRGEMAAANRCWTHTARTAAVRWACTPAPPWWSRTARLPACPACCSDRSPGSAAPRQTWSQPSPSP